MTDTLKAHRTEHPHLDKRDDMYDDAEDMQRPGKLAGALQIWSELANAYWDENHHALKEQKWHRRIVNLAVWAGTIAVILAVVQLLFHDREILQGPLGDWIEKHTGKIAIVEFIAAMAAACTVLWGVISKMQKEWLLKRHKAERMRMLKYRSLLKFAAAGMDDVALERLRAKSSEKLHRIQDTEEEQMEEWISVNQTWEEDLEPEACAVTPTQLDVFLEYYRRKRLDAQTQYFNKKATQAGHRDSITRLLPPLLFVASIICAACHFGIEAFTGKAQQNGSTHAVIATPADKKADEGSSRPDTIALLLIVGAASFPILGAAFHTYRSAYEFSRNSKRFRATYTDLSRTGGSVQGKDKNPAHILEELWKAEQSLEREHREWLRLMVEAEWYG
jgi:hypothetical protein